MNIAILGYSRQGQSAYEYWNKPGNSVTICDQNTAVEVPSGVSTQLGKDYLNNLGQYDLLVRTPALHPRDIVAANPEIPSILSKVTTVTNEFFKICPSKNIIGVTGTKGKGTTSTLIASMLEADGKRVHLGGNIGIAPLDMLQKNIQPDDWVVLELANFQLIDLVYSPRIAVCLLIEPEHLDWHTDMNEYIESKSQLFMHQKAHDIAIYYAKNENSRCIASHSPGVQIPYLQPPGACVEDGMIKIDGLDICSTAEIKLLGQHNWQNVCAAITTVWEITQNISSIREAITSFIGLPHRLEPVRNLNDVTYYNDSFASAPPATMAALAAIKEPKIMIIGGFDRELNLEDLSRCFLAHSQSIRKVIIIGQARNRIAESFKKAGFNNFEVCDLTDMRPIVERAQELAKPGDAIMLSPGFASFDMFKDFEQRGEMFKEAVAAL